MLGAAKYPKLFLTTHAFFVGTFVVAFVLGHHQRAASGAHRARGLVPEGEFASWVFVTAIKNFTLARAALHDFALGLTAAAVGRALGTLNTRGLNNRLGVFAIREPGSGVKLAKPAELFNNRLSAKRANFIRWLAGKIAFNNGGLFFFKQGRERIVKRPNDRDPRFGARGNLV